MNVSAEKLMRLLGSRMVVSGQAPRWGCPLHPDQDGCMTASSGPRVVFTCSSPSCRFMGDAAALVSMARGVSLEEAVAMLSEGGELAECMEEPLSGDDVASYLDAASSQAVVKAFLSKCSMALRDAPERSGVRAGMSRASLRMLHPEMGLFVDLGQEVPKCLREFTKPKYRGSSLVLYPYRFNGDVTRIDVVDANDPSFRHTAVVLHPTLGVFGETCACLSGRVVAVERPDDAARLYAEFCVGSTKPPPVVAYQGYPLPEAFRYVNTIDILSAKGSEASMGFLLRAICAPEIRAGVAPVIRGVVCSEEIRKLRHEDVSDMKGSRLFRFHDIQHLIAKRMSKLVDEGREAEVLSALSAEQAPPVARSLLKSAAETQISLRGGFGGRPESAARLVELLSAPSSGKPCDMALANGKSIHCGPDGVFAIRSGGAMEPLCNVGIAVDSRIVGSDGAESFECTVSARGGFPAAKVRVPLKGLTADRMRDAVQSAYSEMGLSPYIAFYPSPGFAWRDVMARMAENCQVERRKPIRLPEKVSGGGVRLGKVSATGKEQK